METQNPNTEVATQQKNEMQLQSFDLTQKLPNLYDAVIIPIDFSSEYWTPMEEGEFKHVFIQEIVKSIYTDEKTGEIIELPCVTFIEEKDGIQKCFRNGSKRLVATIENELNNGKIFKGSPIRIEYLGKQKNATNAFQSDRWSIRPLFVVE